MRPDNDYITRLPQDKQPQPQDHHKTRQGKARQDYKRQDNYKAITRQEDKTRVTRQDTTR